MFGGLGQDELDCILLDVVMPDMHGKQAFLEMFQIRPDAKIIICSVYNEQMLGDSFSGCGLAGFIEKPYTLTTLQEKLTQVLS